MYEIVKAKSGQYTLKMQLKDKSIYLHSKYDPQKEGRILAETYYEPNVNNYLIFGLAFGYHLVELIKKTPDANFYVIETNREIYDLAIGLRLLDEINSNSNVKVFVTSDINRIRSILADFLKLTETKVIVHSPSLDTMSEQLNELKHILENFKVIQSSYENENYIEIMKNNFESNIKQYDCFANLLFNKFTNIPIFIVSAGPSLDNNIKELKKVKNKGVILAVGTAVKPLLKSGIIPNLIIMSDLSPQLYKAQLDNLDLSAPVIGLSTTDKNIMINYNGIKLLALQEGYSLAEDYALKNNIELVNTGGSVSTLALDLAIKMGSNKIIFVGQDLAYTNNKSHSSIGKSKEVKINNNSRIVKDIYGNDTHTSKSLYIYLKWIQNRILKEANITFIDATEGGAYIQGTQISTLKETIESCAELNLDMQEFINSLLLSKANDFKIK